MDSSDVEFLRCWLEEAPEFGEIVGCDPPRAFHRSRWKPIVGLALQRSIIVLQLQGGKQLRLPLGPRRREANRPAGFWQRILRHNFPRARIRKVLQRTDRRLHQSAAFVRMLVQEGSREKALMWVAPEEGEVLRERLLTALLLWWHQLASRSRADLAVCLVPDTWSRRIVAGLGCLKIPVNCYRYCHTREPQSGALERIYPAPAGVSSVSLPYVIFPELESAPSSLQRLANQYRQLRLSRRAVGWELNYKGLPVAWSPAGTGIAWFNVCDPRQLHEPASFDRHFEEVRRVRRFPSAAPQHPFYTWKPERWLEHEVIKNHGLLDSAFGSDIYSQVPTCMDGERKILDLLTCTKEGQLAVIELKAGQDLNLIFQALEYWGRVGVHLQRGDFQTMGYFPRRHLQPHPPLLYLVCPLFEYHRVLPTIRRYLVPGVKFRCIGVNSDWRRGLRVIRRFEF